MCPHNTTVIYTLYQADCEAKLNFMRLQGVFLVKWIPPFFGLVIIAVSHLTSYFFKICINTGFSSMLGASK